MGPGSEDFDGDDFKGLVSSPIEQHIKPITQAYVESSNKISQPLVPKGGQSRYTPNRKESHDYLEEDKPVGDPQNPEYPSYKINYPRAPKPRVHFSKPSSNRGEFSRPETTSRNIMDQQPTNHRDDGQTGNDQYWTHYRSQPPFAPPHIDAQSNPYAYPYPPPWLQYSEWAHKMNQSSYSGGSPQEPAVPKQDPEKLKLEAEIKALKLVEERIKAQEKQRETEAQIRKDAEQDFRLRMEAMREAQDEARREIDKVREDAERAVADNMEKERREKERAAAEMNAYKTQIEDDFKRKLDIERLAELQKEDAKNRHFEEFGELFKEKVLKGIEDIIFLTKEKTRLEIEHEKETARERQAERKQLLLEVREELKAEGHLRCEECSSIEIAAPQPRALLKSYPDERRFLTISDSVAPPNTQPQTNDEPVQMDPSWSLGPLSVPKPPGTPDSGFGYETAQEGSTRSSGETASSSDLDSTSSSSYSSQDESEMGEVHSDNNMMEIEDTVHRIVDAFVRRLTGPICWDVGNFPAPQPWQYQSRHPLPRKPSYFSGSSSSYSESSYEEDEESIPRARSRQKRVRSARSHRSSHSYHKAFWRKQRVRENRIRSRSNLRPGPGIEEATRHSDNPTAAECELPPAPEPPLAINGSMGVETSDFMASEAETNLAHADSDLENNPPDSVVEEVEVRESELLTWVDSETAVNEAAPQHVLEDAGSKSKADTENATISQADIVTEEGNSEPGISKAATTIISEAHSSPDENDGKSRENNPRKSMRSRSCDDARPKEPPDPRQSPPPVDDKELQAAGFPPTVPNFWPKSFIGRPVLLPYKQTTNVLDFTIPQQTSMVKDAANYESANLVSTQPSNSTNEIERVD